MHPLLDVMNEAAGGSFPAVDGGVTFVPPLDGGLEAVISFTGHAYVATRLSTNDLADLSPDGYGQVLHPSILMRMAGDGGWVGVIDATLVAHGVGGGGMLGVRRDLEDHPRVLHARDLRSDVEVFGDEFGLVTIGHGVAGRLELSIELFDTSASQGAGRRLIETALGLIPDGVPVFAGVSPGNARSLRAFLACGFSPIGSEVVIRPGQPG